jgi:hypothetical protein
MREPTADADVAHASSVVRLWAVAAVQPEKARTPAAVKHPVEQDADEAVAVSDEFVTTAKIDETVVHAVSTVPTATAITAAPTYVAAPGLLAVQMLRTALDSRTMVVVVVFVPVPIDTGLLETARPTPTPHTLEPAIAQPPLLIGF